MKTFSRYFVLILLLITSFDVYATSYNTSVKKDMTLDECLSYQDKEKSSSENGYFAHCVKATCYGGVWKTGYYIASDLVKCTNGNQNKYRMVVNDGCTPYVGSCTPTVKEKYCGRVSYYDCTKTSDGKAFVPPVLEPQTTTTTTTTRRPPLKPQTTKTTTSTTVLVKSTNNYLTDLKVNPGNISFYKFVQNYTIEINKEVTSIEIIPTLEDEKAQVKVENNTSISIDKPILITVTAENGDTRLYTINLKYAEVPLDSNSRIKRVDISGYNLDFDSDITSYKLKINKEKSLDINVELESENATYVISGNENFKNKSRINITVTAQDGSTTTYLINVKKNSDFGGIIIVIMVIGVAGFVGYKLIRKITFKEKETKYEYE